MILVTGGLGFIGSHIALSLLAQGQEVLLVDNLSNTDMSNLERLESITGMNIPFAKVDIRNTPALMNIIQQYAVDSVIHAAGFKSLTESVLKPLEYYNANVSCMMSLLRAMQRTGVRSLVYLSSLAVYGKSSLDLKEEDLFNYHFNNPYIKSLQMAEDILKDTYMTDPEWKIVNLRLANIAGAFEYTNLGELIRPFPKNIVPLAMQVAAGQREFIELRKHDNTEDKTAYRSFVHVMDVCSAVSLSLQWLYYQNQAYEIFNISGENCSIQQLLDVVSKVTNVAIPTIDANYFEGEELSQVGASSEKVQRMFNWKAQKTIKQMIEDEWLFYQKQLNA